MSLLLSNTKEPDLSAQLLIYLTPHTQIRELVQCLNVNISNSTCLNKCLHMKKKTPPSHICVQMKDHQMFCPTIQRLYWSKQGCHCKCILKKVNKPVNSYTLRIWISNLTTRGLCSCQNTEPGRHFVTLIQFNLIYIVPHHNSSHLKVLNSVR